MRIRLSFRGTNVLIAASLACVSLCHLAVGSSYGVYQEAQAIYHFITLLFLHIRLSLLVFVDIKLVYTARYLPFRFGASYYGKRTYLGPTLILILPRITS